MLAGESVLKKSGFLGGPVTKILRFPSIESDLLGLTTLLPRNDRSENDLESFQGGVNSVQELSWMDSRELSHSFTHEMAVKEMPGFTMKTKFGSSQTFISGDRWLSTRSEPEKGGATPFDDSPAPVRCGFV
uniref:Uncharacterized protein n=1 Tax=Timema douglasi TaxID=61478 RepID=A0A7R8Z8V1_TIMDO|nr:unnamed protein product [Timema douglasi]